MNTEHKGQVSSSLKTADLIQLSWNIIANLSDGKSGYLNGNMTTGKAGLIIIDMLCDHVGLAASGVSTSPVSPEDIKNKFISMYEVLYRNDMVVDGTKEIYDSLIKKPHE